MSTAITPQPSLPHGFIPVMLTPFLDSGAIDYPALARLTRFYLDAGAAGLFANCLSSEMYELTEDERIELTSFVINEVAGQVPVVATGSFGGPVDRQADFVCRMAATGVQAVILTTCQLAAADESDEILLDRLHQLMDLTGSIPLGVYECPVPYKRLITADMLASLLPTGRLIYLKDTSLDAQEVARRLEVARGFTFGLYDAYMVNAVSSLKAGAAGLSCIQGNYFPELIVWLCAHVNDETSATYCQRIQQFLIDSMDILHTAYPVSAKYFLQKRGLPMSTYTRREVDPLTLAMQQELDALAAYVDQLQQTLSIPVVSLKAVQY